MNRLHPRTVLGFCAVQVPTFAIAVALHPFTWDIGLALLLLFILLLGLWRGSRVAWAMLLAFEAEAVIAQAFDPAEWWAFALNLLGLMLLLAGPTRRHVWRAARPAGISTSA